MPTNPDKRGPHLISATESKATTPLTKEELKLKRAHEIMALLKEVNIPVKEGLPIIESLTKARIPIREGLSFVGPLKEANISIEEGLPIIELLNRFRIPIREGLSFVEPFKKANLSIEEGLPIIQLFIRNDIPIKEGVAFIEPLKKANVPVEKWIFFIRPILETSTPIVEGISIIKKIDALRHSNDKTDQGALHDFINALLDSNLGNTRFGDPKNPSPSDTFYNWMNPAKFPKILKSHGLLNDDGFTSKVVIDIIKAMVNSKTSLYGNISWKNSE